MGEAEGRQVITSPTESLLGLLFEYKQLCGNAILTIEFFMTRARD